MSAAAAGVMLAQRIAAGGGGSFDVTIGGNTGDDYSGLDLMVGGSASPDTFSSNPATMDPYGQTRIAVFNPTGASNVTALGTVTLTTARLGLWLTNAFGNGSLVAYDMLRATVLGQMSWNSYSTGNAWATAGAGGSGTDRSASSIGSQAYLDGDTPTGDQGSYVEIDLDLTTMQSKINAGTNYRILIVGGDAANYAEFVGTNASTANGNRPYLRLAGTYA
jgi:hypothetical protein